MFLICSLTAKKLQKIIKNWSQKLPKSTQDRHLGCMWRPLGRHLGSPWGSWAPSWGSWAPSYLIFGLLAPILLPKMSQHSSDMSQDSPNSSQHRPKRPLRNPRNPNFCPLGFMHQITITHIPYFGKCGPSITKTRGKMHQTCKWIIKFTLKHARKVMASAIYRWTSAQAPWISTFSPSLQRNSQIPKFPNFGTNGLFVDFFPFLMLKRRFPQNLKKCIIHGV